jgi:hypothetical protein
MTSFDTLADRSPALSEAYDAVRPKFAADLCEVEAWVRDQAKDYTALDAAIRAEIDSNRAMGLRLALKIAESRRIIRELKTPVTLTLLNPVYKETGRMQPRAEHPHGEDSIRSKIETLREFEDLNSNFQARFVVIDDECPDGSGEMAGAILDSLAKGAERSKHRVLFLGEAIDTADPALPPGLTHKDGARRSVKGGSVLYGMRTCVHDEVEGLHILVDNDADLSIHPAQLGLLIRDILDGNASAVAGSRREEDSVAWIGGTRNTRGQFFIAIWQHFLPELAKVVIDTNRAFKAFEATALVRILDDIQTYTFPYQIELLQACISSNIPLSTCGIGYLDSEAASTQQGENITETYLHQIHQIIDIAKRHGAMDPQDELCRSFEEITEDQWLEIEQNPPERLEESSCHALLRSKHTQKTQYLRNS